MKKRFAIILTAAALSMTGCSLLGQDTYYIDQGMEQINSGNYEEALTAFLPQSRKGSISWRVTAAAAWRIWHLENTTRR